MSSSIQSTKKPSLLYQKAKLSTQNIGFCLLFFFITILLSSLTSCAKFSSRNDIATQKALSVTYQHLTFKSDTVFSATIIVRNTSAKPLTNWQIAIPLQAKIDSISNGRFVIADTLTLVQPSARATTLRSHDSTIICISGAIDNKKFQLPARAYFSQRHIKFEATARIAKADEDAPHRIDLALYPDDYAPTTNIRIGQGRLSPAADQSVDAVIPTNRKTWAMAIAHAHKLFTYASGVENLPESYYFATAMRESNCGCDKAAEIDAAYAFPFGYQPRTASQGCFQLEKGTAYQELHQAYPMRFPENGYSSIVSGSNFETAALTKAHYDLFSVKLLEVSKGYDVKGFFNTSRDSASAVKLLSLAFNRGVWAGAVEAIFSTQRTRAVKVADISTLMKVDDIASKYVKNIANYTNTLNSKLNKLPKTELNISPRTGMPNNMFYSFYDEQIEWADVEAYITKIQPLYRDQNMKLVKLRLHKKFNSINGGAAISFQKQFGAVLDQLVLSLPISDPSAYIAHAYGDKNLIVSNTRSSSLIAARK